MTDRPGANDASRRGRLDSASGLPLHPAARETLLAALDDGWADPLRLYRESRNADLLLNNAREVVAGLLGARADEVSFVSSGTTACQAAVLGYGAGRRRLGQTVVHSAVEHSAVLGAVAWLAGRGLLAESVPVDEHGRVDGDAFVAAASQGGPAAAEGVAVACLQAANHEVGTVQPVDEVAERMVSSGVPLVVDAAAAVGWAPIPTGWAALAASAHKWGGPTGVGVLAIKKGTRWRAPWPVDERNRVQAGYPNIPGALAAAAALQAVLAERSGGGRVAVASAALAAVQPAAASGGGGADSGDDASAWAAANDAVGRPSDAAPDLSAVDPAREPVGSDQLSVLRELTDWLRHEIARRIPDVSMAGHPTERLPHIVNFSCLYVDGEALVTELDRVGFAVSSGSACTSSALEPSHVLVAMGVLTHGNVRVSISSDTTREELGAFVDATADIVTRLRTSTGLPQ